MEVGGSNPLTLTNNIFQGQLKNPHELLCESWGFHLGDFMVEWILISLAIGVILGMALLVNDALPQKYPYLSFTGITVFWPIILIGLILFGTGYVLYNIGLELKLAISELGK